MTNIAKKEIMDFLFRFAEVCMNLSEEDKHLVFAFAQGIETQRMLSGNGGKMDNARSSA